MSGTASGGSAGTSNHCGEPTQCQPAVLSGLFTYVHAFTAPGPVQATDARASASSGTGYFGSQ